MMDDLIRPLYIIYSGIEDHSQFFFSNLGTRAFLDPYFFSLLSEKPLFSPLLSVGGMTGASRGSAGGEHYCLL